MQLTAKDNRSAHGTIYAVAMTTSSALFPLNCSVSKLIGNKMISSLQLKGPRLTTGGIRYLTPVL